MTVSAMIAGWAIGWVAIQVSQDAAPKWLLAHVSGIGKALAMDLAPSTVQLDWTKAKAWLYRELADT